jgi:hypothetical protein
MNDKEQLIQDVKDLTKAVEEVCLEAAEHISTQGDELPNAYELMLYVIEEAYAEAIRRANAELNAQSTVLKGSGDVN